MSRRRNTYAAVVGAGALLLGAPTASAAHKTNHQVTQGNLVAALNNVAVQIDNLDALNNLTVEDVRLVNVENVLNSNRVLNNSRFLNNIEILRDALDECSVASCITIRNVLNNNDIMVSDVVAVSVLSGGDVIVFYE